MSNTEMEFLFCVKSIIFVVVLMEISMCEGFVIEHEDGIAKKSQELDNSIAVLQRLERLIATTHDDDIVKSSEVLDDAIEDIVDKLEAKRDRNPNDVLTAKLTNAMRKFHDERLAQDLRDLQLELDEYKRKDDEEDYCPLCGWLYKMKDDRKRRR